MQEVRSHPYVIHDERISGGGAVIKGTRTRVVDIVIEYEYLVHSPDEIISAHPHLTLQQIHDALSYYYENRGEIDKKIKDEQEFVNGLRKVFQGKNLGGCVRRLKTIVEVKTPEGMRNQIIFL